MSSDYLTTSKNLSPRPLTNHSMGILNRRIFVYGDDDESDYFSGKFWQYDIHWKNWLNINKPNKGPIICYFSQIVVDNKSCFVIECEDNFTENGYINITRFDSDKYSWEILTNLSDTCNNPNDSVEDLISMFHYRDALYIFSVTYRNPSSNIIFRYSLIENSWSCVYQKGDIPQKMYNISGSVLYGRYYCFGDLQYYTNDIFHHIHIFDLKTHEWSQNITYPDFDRYPSYRIDTSISFTDTHGFLSAGKGISNEIFDDLWCIDLRTLKWFKYKFNLKHKISRHTSVIYNNSTLFLFGGIINNNKVNMLQKYTIEPPSLYNISVSVLLKNTKELSELENVPIGIRKNILPLKYDLSSSD